MEDCHLLVTTYNNDLVKKNKYTDLPNINVNITHIEKKKIKQQQYYENRKKKDLIQGEYCNVTLPTPECEEYTWLYKKRMLKSLIKQLVYMVDYCSKVMMVRIDLHFPIGYNYDGDFSYISQYQDLLKKRLDVLDNEFSIPLHTRLFWTMEQTPTAELPHFHTLVMLNGQAMHNVLRIYKLCSLCWKSVLKEHYKSGLVHCPTLKYIGSQYRDSGEHDLADRECIGAKQYIAMLRFDRDASVVKEDVGKTISMLSYLCKAWSKYKVSTSSKRVRTYGSSELKGYVPRIDHIVKRTHGVISRRMIVELFDLYDPSIMSL